METPNYFNILGKNENLPPKEKEKLYVEFNLLYNGTGISHTLKEDIIESIEYSLNNHNFSKSIVLKSKIWELRMFHEGNQFESEEIKNFYNYYEDLSKNELESIKKGLEKRVKDHDFKIEI